MTGTHIRTYMALAVAVALIAAACSGSDAATEEAAESATGADSTIASSDDGSAVTSAEDDLADVQADALVEDGGLSPEDAEFIAHYPIPALAGGEVLVTFEDGTVSQLNLAYPLDMKDQLLLHYGIWAQGTITESHFDDSQDHEGSWQGLNADGVLIAISVVEPVDMEDTVLVNLVWQP